MSDIEAPPKSLSRSVDGLSAEEKREVALDAMALNNRCPGSNPPRTFQTAVAR
jgi:hypothetical protein